MAHPKIDWEELAYQQGYKYDDRKMLETMYATMTLEEMETRLGVSHKSISKRLDTLGIERRQKGDPIPRHGKRIGAARLSHHRRRG